MDTELFDKLEKSVDSLLTEYLSLKQENELLKEENLKLQLQRDGVRDRLDVILKKLDGIELR
jgi:cell division protein ZapB